MARPAPADGGTLFVVATPIGNLEDISLRALRVLGEVQVVAAEDTRRTGHLLQHYGIRTRLVSLHQHNERQRTATLVDRLRQGDAIALVTDAGTPGISDPGAVLVAAAREAGLRVEPIPGPSAVATALSVSGLGGTKFAFLGFPPVRSKDRKTFFLELDRLADMAVVLFEAPHRLERTLTEMAPILVDRPIFVAREVTKAHEELVWASAGELATRFSGTRGELTLVVAPRATDSNAGLDTDVVPDDVTIGSVFGEITKNETIGRREAIRECARRTGTSARNVFDALERLKEPN